MRNAMQKTLTALAGALLFVGCRTSETNSPPGQQAKPTPIIFDDWWNIDYVQSGCEIRARNAMPCATSTPKDVVREFDSELEVAVPSESDCHGLSLLHFTPEMAKDAVKNPNEKVTGEAAEMAKKHWTLMLDLD